MSQKKRWGDRKDGIWLKDIPAMNRIMPSLLPNRADNEAHISVDIDARPLNAYLEKLNEGRTTDKYTFFHLISAAIGKAFVLRPKMNRFVVGSKMFQRRKIEIRRERVRQERDEEKQRRGRGQSWKERQRKT